MPVLFESQWSFDFITLICGNSTNTYTIRKANNDVKMTSKSKHVYDMIDRYKHKNSSSYGRETFFSDNFVSQSQYFFVSCA